MNAFGVLDKQTDGVDNPRDYYDDFSRSYDASRRGGYHALVDALEVESVRRLADGARVLEVGCGTGLILERLAPYAAGLAGVDLSPGMLERARSRGFDVVEGDALSLPFSDASFDLTVSFKVLPHVRDLSGAIREMARVTRPGGHVAVELYNRCSLRFLAKRLAGPARISERRSESDVYTRWDAPWTLRGVVPSTLEVVDVAGIRVVTPFARAHDVAMLGPTLRSVEWRVLRSPLRWFGGFLVVILRRRA